MRMGILLYHLFFLRVVGEYQDYEINNQLSVKNESTVRSFEDIEDINVDGGLYFEDEQGK